MAERHKQISDVCRDVIQNLGFLYNVYIYIYIYIIYIYIYVYIYMYIYVLQGLRVSYTCTWNLREP